MLYVIGILFILNLNYVYYNMILLNQNVLQPSFLSALTQSHFVRVHKGRLIQLIFTPAKPLVQPPYPSATKIYPNNLLLSERCITRFHHPDFFFFASQGSFLHLFPCSHELYRDSSWHLSFPLLSLTTYMPQFIFRLVIVSCRSKIVHVIM